MLLMRPMLTVKQLSISSYESLFIMDFGQWMRTSTTSENLPDFTLENLPDFKTQRDKFYDLSDCLVHYSIEKSEFHCMMSVAAPGGNKPSS